MDKIISDSSDQLKVHIFETINSSELEQHINEWLNNSKLIIINILQSSTLVGSGADLCPVTIITIFYKEYKSYHEQ